MTLPFTSRFGFSGEYAYKRLAGPWKGVSGEGRARRGSSVMRGKKIDVHVHHF